MTDLERNRSSSSTISRRLFMRSALVSLALGVALFGCQRQPKTLKIGYIPIADCSQLFVAVERGYFREEGLEPELVSMAGGSKILEALGTGSLDIGFSNIVSLVLAHEAKIPFKIIVGGPAEDAQHAEHAIVVAHGSSITKIADLSGKRIALNTRRNIDELMVTTLLKRNGVLMNSISFVEIPFPRQPTVLSSGEVDAIATIEPFVTVSLDAGHTILSRNYVDVDNNIDISAYAATDTWIQANNDLALKFRRALQRSTEFINAHPKETREILGKFTHLDRKLLDRITLPQYRGAPSVESIDRTISYLADEGWIKTRFPAGELVASGDK